ncbi:MAG TPA: hypothetical protein PLV06_06115 [Bacteroidales bacterium]|nr:hypothetical protein [Bacteroidales bacterium]HPJ58793.1 hypothetical protein [Bacteroidales bacterium]HPR11943.1 hypothetical protein [Bacteroidales bacterium]HRW85765.1 hypothetical protein [Bacteroidales bacterium]
MEYEEVWFERYGESGLQSQHYGRLKTLKDANGSVTGYSGCIEGFAMYIWSRAASREELAENLYGIIDRYREDNFHEKSVKTCTVAGKEFFVN